MEIYAEIVYYFWLLLPRFCSLWLLFARQGPGAERVPGSFLVYAENAREKVGIFFSPSLQSRASTRKSRSGLSSFFSARSSRQSGIFFSPSLQAGPGAERAPGSFLICAKRRPRLLACVLFRSLFAGKARYCGAVKNFFQPPQEPSVLTGKNASGHMPKESFRTYPSP